MATVLTIVDLDNEWYKIEFNQWFTQAALAEYFNVNDCWALDDASADHYVYSSVYVHTLALALVFKLKFNI